MASTREIIIAGKFAPRRNFLNSSLEYLAFGRRDRGISLPASEADGETRIRGRGNNGRDRGCDGNRAGEEKRARDIARIRGAKRVESDPLSAASRRSTTATNNKMSTAIML